MADKTPIKKVAKKAAAKRVAAKSEMPRTSDAKSDVKSSARKPVNAAVKELPAHYAVQVTATKRKGPAVAAKLTLLTGGNPQIAKGEGDGPVQDYIAAMPGWKSDVGRRLDALIVRTVPGVRKRSNGTRRCTGWRAKAGSSASIASRTTSRWLSSAARRCVLFPLASPRARKRATSTSMRTTSSTKLSSSRG